MDHNDHKTSRFITDNLSRFSVSGAGWNRLICSMLHELCLAGWDMESPVTGEEKSGELRCYAVSPDEKVNAGIQKIVNAYSELSAITCRICGKPGKIRHRNGWQATLCLEHYLETVYSIEIKEGRLLLAEFCIGLEEISRAECTPDFKKLTVFFTDTRTGREKSAGFSWQEPNYYLLLKSIPENAFAGETGGDVAEMFSRLQFCEICGYFAVHEYTCLRCHHDAWQDDFPDAYDGRLQYIKRCQMDVYIDEDDYEKVFRADRSFDKKQNHSFLFTDKELEEYKDDL